MGEAVPCRYRSSTPPIGHKAAIECNDEPGDDPRFPGPICSVHAGLLAAMMNAP